MKMPSVDQICNIAGCVLIFVLLALLVLKPNGVMSLFEGNSPNAKPPAPKKAAAPKKSAPKVEKPKSNKVDVSTNKFQDLDYGSQGTGVQSSMPLGDNEQFAAVSGIQTPTRSCYPQNTLSPDQLLPKDDKDNISNFNKDYPISEGILKGVNFLDAGYQIGVNTVGQSLRNANRQIRSEPPNPQVSVSPWLNTTIGPDLSRQPLEIGEDCYGNNKAI
jgi:hypothetical protein